MSNIFFFDTETTGLPLRFMGDFYPPSKYHSYDSSRIVQIAWIITSNTGDILSKESHLIYPSDFKVQGTEIHGITHEKALEEGVPLHRVLDILYNRVKTCGVLCAHNLQFDYSVLLAECHRINKDALIRVLSAKEQYCTMKVGRHYLQSYKYPKLKELYETLYGEKWEQKHDALDDTEKCVLCYRKLIEHSDDRQKVSDHRT